MKKLGIFIAASALTLSLAACGSGASSTTTTAAAAETTAAASAETTAAAGAATELTEISAGMCSTPAILTSIGQSADVDIANTLCTKAGIEVTMNKNITGADLPDDCKTLILAVGGSSKGLGAAGIDADQELARTDALISAAKEKGCNGFKVWLKRSALSRNISPPSSNVTILSMPGNKENSPFAAMDAMLARQ